MSAFRRFFSFQSGLRKGLAATLAALLVLALFGASGPAGAITVVKTGTPGPYSFSTSQTSGQAGTCSYTDGALNKISVVSPLAAERAFWTVPHNGVVTNGQFVHYIQRLYGLKGSTWTLLRTESVEVLVHASLTRMPTLAAFTPKNGMIAGYYTFRVTEELRWVNPIVGGIEGSAKITLATYWDGHAWLVNCHVAPSPVYKVGAIPTDSSVKIQWSNPSSAYFAGVRICSTQGTTYPSSQTSGTCRTLKKPLQSTTFSPRPPNTTYSFVLWAFDVYNHYSIRKTARITTLPLPGAVTNLHVTGTSATSVSLAWTTPTSADYAGVRICRADGSTPPASPSCTTHFDRPKPDVSFVDTSVSSGHVYSYAAFAYDSQVPPVYIAPGATGITGATTPSVITTTSLTDASIGVAYSDDVAATGAVTGGMWSLTSSPGWLSIDPSTGHLSGTPGTADTSTSVTVVFTDGHGVATQKVLSLTVGWVSGDVNGDGTVQCGDAYTIEDDLGLTTQTHLQGDLNGDGTVDGADLALWTSAYTGPGCIYVASSFATVASPISADANCANTVTCGWISWTLLGSTLTAPYTVTCHDGATVTTSYSTSAASDPQGCFFEETAGAHDVFVVIDDSVIAPIESLHRTPSF